MKQRLFGFFVVSGLISIFLFAGCVPVTPGSDAASCSNLKKLSFQDEAFGKDITFTSAKFLAATANLPAHCEVQGRIWPETDFIIKLPKNWNSKFIYYGGGGIDGSAMAAEMTPGLKLGYAAAVSNGGHNGKSMMDASFAYDQTDDGNGEQKLKDFGYRAHHETPALTKKLIKSHYGSAPTYSYWIGCSNGGREGMMEAQRYPQDFDGYVIGAPVLNYTGTTLRGVWNSWVQQGAAALSNNQIPNLGKAIYSKCDGYDGMVDGLIDDPRSCDFNPDVDLKVCAWPSATCFTKNQIGALKKIYAGPKDSQGEQLFPGTPFGAELGGILGGMNGWVINIMPLVKGTMADPLAAGFMMYAAFDPDPGPDWDYTTYDFDVDPGRTAALGVPEIVDAVDPNLALVKNKGAKIIHYHGWIDTVITPFMSINYYEDVMAELGPEATRDFYKLYLIPGMHHCMGGPGCGMVDWLAQLVNWVEKGIAPEAIVGNSTDGTMSRPLCPYPQVARYTGTGSTDKAENFQCVSLP